MTAMSDPLAQSCRRCGAAPGRPCTDRAGRARRNVHTARRRLAQPFNTAPVIEWLRHVDHVHAWCAEELAARSYVTYGILDPRTGGFVYVGQSGSFALRIACHLRARPERPHPRFRPIRAWIWDAVKAGRNPRFRILDVCDTKEQSLASEALWVGRLASDGHRLLNRACYTRCTQAFDLREPSREREARDRG
jgi:hypothetical protein